MLSLADQTATVPYGAITPVLFYAMALLVVLSAWAIVVSQNIVRMAVYLLLTLAGVAGLYFMLHAEFLAAIQLIVYAGGTLILIVFGVMLTSKNPFMQLKTALWERMIGVLIGLLIFGLMLLAKFNTIAPVGVPVAPSRGGHYQVAAIGRALLSDYLVPFEVTAVLLLVVMIGAAFMARRSAK